MVKVNTELLISAVQARTVLWQDTLSDHKNRNITDKLWKEVGEICGCSGGDAKSKWKNLKDTYRRLLQKIPRPLSGSAASLSGVKWAYFEAMSFTKDTVQPDATEGNLNIDNNSEDLDYTMMINEILNDDENVPNNCSTPAVRRNNKRKRSNGNEEFLNLEREKLTLLKSEMAKDEDDDDLQFFKSLLPAIKTLTVIEKFELRADIQQIILSKIKAKENK